MKIVRPKEFFEGLEISSATNVIQTNEGDTSAFELTKEMKLTHIKVTVYLQGCLACKRCSASGLNWRYLNPYIKLKLIELAIKLYQEF